MSDIKITAEKVNGTVVIYGVPGVIEPGQDITAMPEDVKASIGSQANGENVTVNEIIEGGK